MPQPNPKTPSGKTHITESHRVDTIAPNTALSRAWWLQLIGGLLLATALFLPAWPIGSGWRTDLAVLERPLGPPINWPSLIHLYCGGVAQYVFGALVAIPLIIRIRNPQASLTTASAVCVSLSIPAILDTGYLWSTFVATHAPDMGLFEWTWCFVFLVTAGYSIIFVCKGRRFLQCAKFAVAIYFALELVERLVGISNALVGRHVAALGASLIAIGTFNEIRARTRATIPKTLYQLLTANPKFIDNDPTKCSYCGYTVAHLKTPRCPECGQPCTIP